MTHAGQPAPAAPTAPPLRLARWTVTTGSNVHCRGAVIVDAGDRHWRASEDGDGAIDALFSAVDHALVEILGGRPRLLAFDVHALGEGTDAIGEVTVRVAPPAADGPRGQGEYVGEARGVNIVAASIEAYLAALNEMLAEPHWAGAAEVAASTSAQARQREPVAAGVARKRRAEIDEEAGEIDTVDWFNQ